MFPSGTTFKYLSITCKSFTYLSYSSLHFTSTDLNSLHFWGGLRVSSCCFSLSSQPFRERSLNILVPFSRWCSEHWVLLFCSCFLLGLFVLDWGKGCSRNEGRDAIEGKGIIIHSCPQLIPLVWFTQLPQSFLIIFFWNNQKPLIMPFTCIMQHY